MNILYLAHRIPYPPNKGDKIRSFNQIKALSDEHQIDLVCLADDPGDLQYKKHLTEYCRKVEVFPLVPTRAKIKGALNILTGGTISTAYFYQSRAQKAVDWLLSQNSYDAVVCFSSVMAEYVFRSGCGTGDATLLMDFCDVDSDKWRQYSVDARFPLNFLYDLEFKRLLKYEKKVNQEFDRSIFVTQQEAELFLQLCPEAKDLHIVQNGVDHLFFSSQSDFPVLEKDRPTIVFTGAMDYHANVDAVVWFCEKMWPTIKAEIPDCCFYIVGSKPTAAVRELESSYDDVVVTGFVDDIRSYYALADVCVIPLRLARGVQNKVLEAMAMGKAVVTTDKAASGVGAISGEHLLTGNEPNELVSQTLCLLSQRKQCQYFGNKAQAFVKDGFDWGNNMKQFATLLSKS